MILKEDNIIVNLTERYQTTFHGSGPISILMIQNFSYNWLYIEVDNITINDIYDTANYPEIDSSFLSFMKDKGPYLCFDLNLLPGKHQLGIKGNGSISYKIVVNNDWDNDRLDDVEEIQQRIIYDCLDPTKPNIWGFFEKNPDIAYNFNKSGIGSGYFHFYIPESYLGSKYLYISTELGEISNIIVDNDELTLKKVQLSNSKYSNNNKETPYGRLKSGYHLVNYEYILNQSVEISFFIDNKKIIILDKYEFKDSDGDGLKDHMEKNNGLNIYSKDSDSDGLPDNFDASPLYSIQLSRHNMNQIVIPHNESRNTLINMIIERPDPDYSTRSTRIWNENEQSSGGFNVIIKPMLRLFGNESITREELTNFWKNPSGMQGSYINTYSLVDSYDSTSYGDTIPDPEDPQAEFMFVNPRTSNKTYEFDIFFPKGHPAKKDIAIDLRFDFVWVVMYYNATRDLNLLHYYNFEEDINLLSMSVRNIGNVNYLLGSPDSMIENQMLWALTQNPRLGSPSEYNLTDDIVGKGLVDYFQLINQTLEDRKNFPKSINESEVLYVSGKQNSFDVLSKIKIKNECQMSFETNHSGEYSTYFSFYTISNVYDENNYDLANQNISGENTICYTIRWKDFSENGVDNYQQRANINGLPINMKLYNYGNSQILKIARVMGFDIPITTISNLKFSNLHDKLIFRNQTYIESIQQNNFNPYIGFDPNKHLYKEIIDDRHWKVEKSKLIFEDYGYPISKIINKSYYEFQNSYKELLDFRDQFPILSNYYNVNFDSIWNDIIPTVEKIRLLNSFSDFINNLPNKILAESHFNNKLQIIVDNLEGLLSSREIYMNEENFLLNTLGTIFGYSTNLMGNCSKFIGLEFKLNDLLEEKSRFSKFVDLSSILVSGYDTVKDIYEFYGSINSLISGQVDLELFLKRMIISLGTVALDGLKTLYGVIKLFPNKILDSKTLTNLAKYSGKIILFIQVAIEVIDILFFDLPNLMKLAKIDPFSTEFYLEVTKVITKVGFSIIAPIILGTSVSTGVGIVIGIVTSVALWIVDWFLFRNAQQEEVPNCSPHLKISDDPGETTITLHRDTKDDYRRSGSLTILDSLRLYLTIINDGDTHLKYVIKAGILNPGIPKLTSYGLQEGDILWADTDGGCGAYGYWGSIFPGESQDLLFPQMYIPQCTSDLTVIIRIYLEYNNPATSTYDFLCNITDKIPLGLPVLPNSIESFNQMTEEISNIDYEYLKSLIESDVAQYQYKDASEKLDLLRNRITHDFLEENDGNFPSDWIDGNSANCHASIVPYIAGHSKVLELNDASSNWCEFIHVYDNFDMRNSGTLEFWYYHEYNSLDPSDFIIRLTNSITQKHIAIILGTDNNIYISNTGRNYENIVRRSWIYENLWYHFRIQFKSDGSFNLWINNVKVVSNHIISDPPSSINQLHFFTNYVGYGGCGKFYIDCIDYSWSNAYYLGRSQYCWNYTLNDINSFHLNYTNLPIKNNMRLDLNEEYITINSTKGFTNINFPLVSNGTDNPLVHVDINFLDSNFYTDTPNFTFSLLANLSFIIFSSDPNYFGGIYYFQIDLRLNSTKELIFTYIVPFKLLFNRDLDFSTSNTIYRDNKSRNFYSGNANNKIDTPKLELDVGNIIYIRCKTNTKKEVTINLYDNSEMKKSLILINQGNLNLKDRFIELKISRPITFNKYSLGFNFYDSEYLRIYDIVITNASVYGPDNLLFNALNISNNGNVDEFISLRFSGIPFDFVDKTLYPNEFYNSGEQTITLCPKSSRICLFNMSKPNKSKDNLFSRIVNVENSLNDEIYTKYADYLVVDGIHILNPRNITYNVYNEYDRGELLIEFISEDNLIWMDYSLDGGENISFSGPLNIPMPDDGLHSIQIFGKNALNISFKSEIRYFEIKSSFIEILNPQSEFYLFSYFEGIYKSTYGFDFDKNGKIPQGWEANYPYSPYVIGLVDGHKKVVNMGSRYCRDTFIRNTKDFPRNYGTIEFWVRFDDVNYVNFFIDILETNSQPNNQCISIHAYNNFWYYKSIQGESTPENYNPVPSMPSLQNDRWYHIRIDFRCLNAPEYLGLSFNSYLISINGLTSTELNFTSSNSEICSSLTFRTKEESLYSNVWIDAVGFSWDSTYKVGENLQIGIPFAFKKPSYLDSLYYSYDYQNPIPILGNSTMILLSKIGYHEIKIFGTAKNGTHFENTRAFAVSQFEFISQQGHNISLFNPIIDMEINFEEILDDGNFLINKKDTSEDPLSFSTWYSYNTHHEYNLLPVGTSYYEMIINLTFMGSISVIMPYDENQLQGSEEYLRLFNSGTDITTHLDTENNLICGEFNVLHVPELVVMEVVDTKEPAIFLNISGSLIESTSKYSKLNSEAIVKIISIDEFSDFEEIYYKFFEHENWTLYINPIIFNEDGNFDLFCKSIDSLGNEANMRYEINIDKTPPKTNLIIQSLNSNIKYKNTNFYMGTDGYYHLEDASKVKFTFSATDIYLGYNISLSPWDLEHGDNRYKVNIFYFVIQEGHLFNLAEQNFELYEGEFKIEKPPGAYNIYFYGVDTYGNIESINTMKIIIDTENMVLLNLFYMFMIILIVGHLVGLSSYFIIKKYKKKLNKRAIDIN